MVLLITVWTVIVVSALNVAWVAQQSPTSANSAAFHPLPRPSMLPAPVAVALPDGVVSTTASSPLVSALASKVVPLSSEAVNLPPESGLAGEFV